MSLFIKRSKEEGEQEEEVPETQVNGEEATITPGQAPTLQEAETPKKPKLKLPIRHWE